ncbi:DUF1054 domain-containing protein [Bacillus sp. DJP31]|uniref:DUF1054 domain-containing protein n=1 Tax=Bacillus sp. DJP31 TaxID=3409789 RepID=UPI003BB78D40
MIFNGFSEQDFQTFLIEGLDNRMESIKENIQPKFKELGDILCQDISGFSGVEMYLHIAKHLRRTVNPPKDTWLAICHNKRGYKQHPHFQIGLFDDHVFIWLAFIYELPNKTEIANAFLKDATNIYKTIPPTYVMSMDHTKKESKSIKDISKPEFIQSLEYFKNVKKAEFLIGRHVQANDELLKNGEAFIEFARETFKTLMPIYKQSL